jgi:hypothetical protein
MPRYQSKEIEVMRNIEIKIDEQWTDQSISPAATKEDSSKLFEQFVDINASRRQQK